MSWIALGVGTRFYLLWNSPTTTIIMLALYDKRCSTPLCWYQDGVNMVVGPWFLQWTTKKIKLIQERMKASKSRQKSYANK